MADRNTALTAKIVTAYLGGNAVAVSDIPALIQTTYAALVNTASPVSEPIERQPAVSVKKSVTPDAIICLECGRHQKMLKRHVATAHGLSVDDYRAKWSLPADYPMVAPDYAERRSMLAIKIGLGHSRKKPEPNPVLDRAEPVEEKPQHHYPPSRWSKPTA